MHKLLYLLLFCATPFFLTAQDLGQGLIANDLEPRPMQAVDKPGYLDTIVDPSFGTVIRRISDAGAGGVIKPMYSTVQAWNADESLMILYNQGRNAHELLDGTTYEYLRDLDETDPADIEQLFWDFNDPDFLYYPERGTDDFIRLDVVSGDKETIVNMAEVSGCTGAIEMGNDIQMMSWDSDVFSWRCGSDMAFSYRISTEQLTTFAIDAAGSSAPAVAPSGERYYHATKAYGADGTKQFDLNEAVVGEHSCIGQMANGNDAHFAISFEQGPAGGCLGDVIAHDLTTGECIPIISREQGYAYSQSGTHISALAHKNTMGGWLAASMVGYDQDGQSLLDQELVIARADRDSILIYRIGHHRADEDQFDYFGEPHAVISPTGTRVLFGSDWSGPEEGQSVDAYVVELPAYSPGILALGAEELKQEDELNEVDYYLAPNPVADRATLQFANPDQQAATITVFDVNGRLLSEATVFSDRHVLRTAGLPTGLYVFRVRVGRRTSMGRFIRE